MVAPRCVAGTFQKSTGAAPASQTVPFSPGGTDFIPNALILKVTGQTSYGSFSVNANLAVGVCTRRGGSQQAFAVAVTAQDNVSPTVTKHRHARKALTIIAITGALAAECDISSFGVNEFTINWTTNDATAYEIEFFAILADDAYVMEFNALTAGGPTQALTGAGFQPDAMALFMTVAESTVPPVTGNFMRLTMGFQAAAGQTQACGITCESEHAVAAANSFSHMTNADWSIHCRISKTGVVSANGRAYISSYDSDGVTLTYSGFAGSAWYGAMLLLKGGSYHALHKNSPTSTGLQSITDPGFQLTGLLNFSGRTSAAGVDIDDACPSLGWASAAGIEGAAAVGSNDAANPSQDDRIIKNDKALVMVNPGSTAAVLVEADIDGFLPNGFRWNWTAVDASARVYSYFAMGGPAPVSPLMPPEPPPDCTVEVVGY